MSIYDVVPHLQMASTIISFVLNSNARVKNVSFETVKRISDYTQETIYQLNLTVKSLRTRESYLIAMLKESMVNSFFLSVAKGVESAAYDHGYKVFFAGDENQTEKPQALTDLIIRESSVQKVTKVKKEIVRIFS